MAARHALIVSVAPLAVALLLIAMAAPAGLGCGQGDCTEIGCSTGVSFELRNVPGGTAGAPRVRACADGRCRTFRHPGGFDAVEVALPGIREQPPVRASVVVWDRAGRPIGQAVTRVSLRKWQPNGRACPPTCYTAGLNFDVRRGRLLRIAG